MSIDHKILAMEEDVNTPPGNKSEAVTPSGTNITQDIIGDKGNNENVQQ